MPWVCRRSIFALICTLQGARPLAAKTAASAKALPSSMLNLSHCSTGFLSLLLPPQNRLLQVMKFLFDHTVEQRILPVVQPCVYFRPVFRPQGLYGSRKQQPFLLFQMVALMVDEVVHGHVEVLPQEFLVRQDGIDGPRTAAQTFGFNLMIAFHVAEALCSSRIARFHLLENHLFLGVMAACGVVLEILDDRLQNFIVCPLAAIEYLEFVLQNEKQFFDVLMLFEQDINDLWHRWTSTQSPPGKVMIASRRSS